MNIRDIITSGTALIAAGAFLVGNVTGDAARPATTVIDAVASSPAAFNPCPAGWHYNQTDEADHGQLASCSGEGGWVVVLDQSYRFEYGLLTTDPAGLPVTNPAEVPGWSR